MEFKAVLMDSADPQKAAAMIRYIKNQFEFLGIPGPRRKKQVKN